MLKSYVSPYPVEPNFQTYRSGARYGLMATTGGVTTAAITGGAGGAANSPVYACPLPVRRTVTISGLELLVGTAVVSVTGKMALYQGDLLAGNGTLVAACSGTADMNSVANTAIALSFSSNQTLAPGLYWACSMFDGAAQPYTLSANTHPFGELGQFIGAPTIAGLIRTSLGLQALRVTSANQDYTVGFPASFGTATVGLGSPGSPYIAMVVA